jgi:proteasome regulatory subunit
MNDTSEELKKTREHLDTVIKERDRLKTEVKKLQKHIQKKVSPPLLVANVSRIIDDNHLILHTPSGNDFLINRPYEKVEPGDTVAVDQSTLRIVKVLASNVDDFVAGMELVKKPKETYSDIGGLDEIITTMQEVVELPLLKPELFDIMGIDPPNGVLMYGAPGTGKTLVARAIANSTNSTFIRLVGSELVQKFIGEGARLVRELFALAREKAPVILFIDEIDAIASKRTQDSQVSDREVQRTLMQLLAEMDGFNPLARVKVIAATNRPDILDPAILRPGRFDRIVQFELPTKEERLEILKIHTRRMPLNGVNLRLYANKWDGLSGADIKAICTEAGLKSIRHVLENARTSGEKINLKSVKVGPKHFNAAYEDFLKNARGKTVVKDVYT